MYHIYTLIDVKNDSCWTQKKRGEGMWKEANAKTSLYNMWVQDCIAFILLQWTQCPIFYAPYQILMYQEYFRVWINTVIHKAEVYYIIRYIRWIFYKELMQLYSLNQGNKYSSTQMIGSFYDNPLTLLFFWYVCAFISHFLLVYLCFKNSSVREIFHLMTKYG